MRFGSEARYVRDDFVDRGNDGVGRVDRARVRVPGGVGRAHSPRCRRSAARRPWTSDRAATVASGPPAASSASALAGEYKPGEALAVDQEERLRRVRDGGDRRAASPASASRKACHGRGHAGSVGGGVAFHAEHVVQVAERAVVAALTVRTAFPVSPCVTIRTDSSASPRFAEIEPAGMRARGDRAGRDVGLGVGRERRLRVVDARAGVLDRDAAGRGSSRPGCSTGCSARSASAARGRDPRPAAPSGTPRPSFPRGGRSSGKLTTSTSSELAMCPTISVSFWIVGAVAAVVVRLPVLGHEHGRLAARRRRCPPRSRPSTCSRDTDDALRAEGQARRTT